MRTQDIKQLNFFLLLFGVILLGFGCEKKESSDYVEGYIVGSFVGDEVNEEGQTTGNKTARGYCILLEGSENKSMDFYTFNFPDSLFTFPDEILSPNYNGNDCGPVLFRYSLKYVYKIKFKYQVADEKNKAKFITDPCTAWLLAFPWDNYDQVTVNEATRN
ncbi:hypothetical protein ACE1ET_02090 [Saccharicrinis sp. FJH62]|uniref:hypothetical protein n=1 Tax=Saccharicrinis sp. FJH62 TaxID=3344657 RepID=UPI0035D405B9